MDLYRLYCNSSVPAGKLNTCLFWYNYYFIFAVVCYSAALLYVLFSKEIQWRFLAHFVLTSIRAVKVWMSLSCSLLMAKGQYCYTPSPTEGDKGALNTFTHTKYSDFCPHSKKKDNTPTWVVVKINIPLIFLFTCSWLMNTAFYFGLTTLLKRLTMWCLCIANKSVDIQVLCFLTLNRMCVSPSNPNWVIFLFVPMLQTGKMCILYVLYTCLPCKLIRKCYIQFKA